MSSPLRAWRSRTEILSLEAPASPAAVAPQPIGEFRTLVRHFFTRFFAGEIACEDRDTKTRLVQAACALAVPPLIFSLYLYPAYHLPHHVLRPYWAQAADHFFFVLYSFVCMGLVTIFEWDLLFPDVLDVFILSPLPVHRARLLASRVAAIFLLMACALLDSSFLAPLVLPAAVDPPSLFRFLAAHVVSVAMAGVFSAAFLLALEGTLVALLGDRAFRKISLWLQGVSVVALLTMLFLCPVLAGSLHSLLASGSPLVRWAPPFWFLGLYQRILDGASTPLLFAQLARTGCLATFLAAGFVVVSYPMAWWRKTSGLVEGSAVRRRRGGGFGLVNAVLHAMIVRTPSGRAVWHFISQNLVRVPRYRMVLVMAGGMGAALVIATVTRVSPMHGRLAFTFSREGLQAIVPIIAFWTVAGLRSTFCAPSDQRGRWVFRITVGKGGLEESRAAERWVRVCALSLSWIAVLWAHFVAPSPLHPWTQALGQIVVASALSVLLTDAFFLNAYTIPFTGTRSTSASNFALLLIPYLGFFPALVFFTVGVEPWITSSVTPLLFASLVLFASHFCLSRVRLSRIAEYLQQPDLDEGEEDFPLRLGLHY